MVVLLVWACGCGRSEKSQPRAEQKPPAPAASASLNLPDFDPALRDHQLIERALRQSNPRLQSSDIPRIQRLGQNALLSSGLRDIRPLSGLTGLEILWLQNNRIVDLSSLAGLTNLTQLFLDQNRASSLKPLTALTRLRILGSSHNALRSAHGLEKMGSLEFLSLAGNDLRDLFPLSSLGALQELHLADNHVTGLTSLSAMSRLRQLFLDRNPLSSLRGIDRCVALEELSLSETGIDSLQPLAPAARLRKLNLVQNDVRDLAPLVGKAAMEELEFDGNLVSSLEPVAGMKSLRLLHASNNRLANLAPLAGLVRLESLRASHNDLVLLDGLNDCTALRRLDLAHNRIRDLAPLTRLVKLEELRLNENSITNLAPLRTLTGLKMLSLGHSQVVDLSPLAGMTALRELDLTGNAVVSLRGLEYCAALEVLNLSGNSVTDLSPIARLTRLRELRLNGNRVASLVPLRGLTNLVHLDLAGNQAVDLSPLVSLRSLKSLNLDHNGIATLQGLEGCRALENVSLARNPITGFDPLRGLSRLRLLKTDATRADSLAPLAQIKSLRTLDLYWGADRPLDEIERLRAALPNCALQQVGLVHHAGQTSPGYTLIAPLSSTTTYLLDVDGHVAHEWPSRFRPRLSAYLLADGSLLRPYQEGEENPFQRGVRVTGGGLQRIAPDGTLLWDFSFEHDRYRLHHDIEPLPNGNVLVIAHDRKTAAEAIAAGRDPRLLVRDELWPDAVLEIQPTGPDAGKIVWAWHVWDHLIQDHDSTRPNFGDVIAHPDRIDLNFARRGQANWTHFNSIDYHPMLDQIIISVHNFNEIWIIDHGLSRQQAAGVRGGLLYRWGNPAAYRLGLRRDRKLFGQHDARWIEPSHSGVGHLLVFNNGLRRRAGEWSSVLELVPPLIAEGRYKHIAKSLYGPIAPFWSYTAPKKTDFYSPNISGAQRLPNGNTLICSGAPGHVFEVTPSGETVWHYINPHHARARGPWGQGGTRPRAINATDRRQANPQTIRRPLFRATRIPVNHPALKRLRLP